jgi:erythromycin esterase-like protein
MKKIFTSILLLFTIFLNAQEIKTIELLPPGSKEHTDLNFLKDELQGKDLVMLGEYTHMYGNIFEMKARIIEYLHEELGYNTIAMEASMYEIWKMNKEGFEPEKFNNAIWGVWGKNEEFQRLVNYIKKNQLKVIGFDSQVMNPSSFIDDFFDYCDEKNISIKLDEDEMGIVIEGILEDYTYEDYDLKFDQFENQLKEILRKIEKLEQTDTNFHWKHFTRNLLAAAREANNSSNALRTSDLISKDHNTRDKEMAHNLLSYIERNSDEKIVVWADNIHVMNDNSSIKRPVAIEFISMGNHIKEKLRDKVYSLATIHSNDSLYDKKWESTPVLKGSFEDKLDEINKPYLFVSSNQDAMNKLYKTRLLSFEDFYEIRLDQVHDGYVFFEHATLPKKKHDRLAKIDKSDNKKDEKEIQKVVQKDIITLKGKILDLETKEPVAFANIILKEEELYRVADENGFFQITVDNRMFENASATISSMGFDGKTIKLKDLKNNTYLSPSFESLNEVIITAHLTPLSVLKKAVKSKYKNHTEKPFNYYRYSNSIINVNDVTKVDVDLITKNNDHGFSSDHVTTKRVEQIRWKKNLLKGELRFTEQIFRGREDAIRYSNILHKRKYKKFNLEFVSSNLEEENGLYIISFKTDRNRWNYTNRGYPTEYSGKVYIDKINFAIINVEQNWKTHLDEEDVKKYYKDRGEYSGEKSITIKEENISYYNKKENNKYYPSRYFKRSYKEGLKKNGEMVNSVFENDSYLYDYEFNNVEEIEYEYYGEEKQTVLNRIEYDLDFWSNFNMTSNSILY